MSVIAINWTRGNKKALATIIPTSYWERLRNMTKFDEYDIQAAHKILKREAGIAYIVLRKIHYNVMRFNNAFELDEAEVFAGRFKSVNYKNLRQIRQIYRQTSQTSNVCSKDVGHLTICLI